MYVRFIERKFLFTSLDLPHIAGDLGVKVALEAAVEPAKMVGLAAAFRMGEEVGREVGRVSGGQAAAMAAAQELAKMNMDEITEEKAREVTITTNYLNNQAFFVYI